MQVLPPSQRGYHLKQLTCAILIKYFIIEFSAETVNEDIQHREQLLKHISKTATLGVSDHSTPVVISLEENSFLRNHAGITILYMFLTFSRFPSWCPI